MDHAMTDGMNISDTSNFRDPGFFRDGPTQNHVHGRTRIADWFGEALRSLPFSGERDDTGAADALDESMGQALVGALLNELEVGRDQLELDRRAAAVKNQHVHLAKRSCGHYITSGKS